MPTSLLIIWLSLNLLQLKDIDELTRKYSMSAEIHQRMHEFFHHKYGGAIHDDDELIQELPLALKIVSV